MYTPNDHNVHDHKRSLVRKSYRCIYTVYFSYTFVFVCVCLPWRQGIKSEKCNNRKSNINKDILKLCLHCHRLLSSSVISCPLLPSSTSSSSHFHTLNRGSHLGTHPEILSLPSSFPPSFLKGIIVHCSIYSPVSVCLCVCVFRYHSSEIALSKRVPGAREAPDSTLMRISTSTQRDSPTDDYHRIQNEISMCSEVKIRGRRRDRDSRRGRGEETEDEGM